MLRLFVIFGLAISSPATAIAQAQAPSPPSNTWARADDRITFTAAGVSFPERAGVTELRQTSEASRQGQGVDNVLQFESPDRQIFATVYVYYPGLPHAGLTAFMTDRAIHLQSRNLRELGLRVTGAGGHQNVAIRGDYAGFRDGLSSSAAFIKLGRWIVKLRVSGPDSRQREVDSAMTALLDGIRFEGRLQPRAATPFQVSECENAAPTAARTLATEAAHVMEDSIIAVMDAAGDEARDPEGNRLDPLPARLGTRWCRSAQLNIGDSSYAVLRTLPADHGGGVGGRSVLVVPISDSGMTLELVETHTPGRFTLFLHEIGRTTVFGSYDGTLSDEQVAGVLSGSDPDARRIRASVDHLPNGNSSINLREAPDAEQSAPST